VMNWERCDNYMLKNTLTALGATEKKHSSGRGNIFSFIRDISNRIRMVDLVKLQLQIGGCVTSVHYKED
jgi:hypothetical protein